MATFSEPENPCPSNPAAQPDNLEPFTGASSHCNYAGCKLPSARGEIYCSHHASVLWHAGKHPSQVGKSDGASDQPANARQVGGDHYKSKAIEPWDFILANGFDFFQGEVIKHVSRWRDKAGLEDLLKARHYLDKYIEGVRAGLARANRSVVGAATEDKK